MLEILKKLPDAEFDIMKVVWENSEPITTSIIMQQLGRKKLGRHKQLVLFCQD